MRLTRPFVLVASLVGAGGLVTTLAVASGLRTASPEIVDTAMLRPTVPSAGTGSPFAFALPRSSFETPRPPALVQSAPDPGYEFYFTRGAYSGGGGGFGYGYGRPRWATDYPEAEYYFTALVDRLIDMDVFTKAGGRNPMYLDDPKLRDFPFLYIVEPGYMNLTDAEVRGLRGYLEAGGFLMMDDFWGSRETANVEYQLARVLPGRPIVDLPLEHPLFHTVYDIEEIRQVPNVSNGRSGGPTWERDGRVPLVRGIFDDEGRLMVVINQNTDLGDAWEWAEDPYYPLDYSTYATEVGINTVVYAMSH
jgi:hypothetical protein